MNYVEYYTEQGQALERIGYSGEQSLNELERFVSSLIAFTKDSYYDSTEYKTMHSRQSVLSDFNLDLSIIKNMSRNASQQRKEAAFNECKKELKEDIQDAIAAYRDLAPA